MKKLPKTLRGERVVLRTLPASFEAARRLFDLVEANRAHISKFLDWPMKVKRAEDEFEMLARQKAERKEGTCFHYGIFAGRRHIGMIDAHAISEKHKSADIGYWLDRDACGRGFMSEAVGVLERAAFSAGFIRLAIGCDVENKASANVAKRCGYTLEGAFRRDNFNGLSGQFRDSYWFAKINDKGLSKLRAQKPRA
ncbi:MAG: GNAT family N-acetyltransferase [Rickettsiales bacterium]|jgi:ribosomal-protein-serine acetyltransferase|nr:GNAT family N-acetyltransferase [Rickettsiales bacterium]